MCILTCLAFWHEVWHILRGDTFAIRPELQFGMVYNLACWHSGMLAFWHVLHLARWQWDMFCNFTCWHSGMLAFWHVLHSGMFCIWACLALGMLAFWACLHLSMFAF